MIFSEGSNLNNSIFGKSQAPIRMFLEKRGEAFEQESQIKNIFKIAKSNKYAEKLTSMTALEGFKPVGENGAYPFDEMQEGYDKIIEHETWKDAFAISQEMVEDATLLQFQQKPLQFVQGYYRTRENFGAALLGGGIGNTVTFAGKKFSTKCADGNPLFYKSHPSKVKGGTQSNCITNAFSATNLGLAETAMQNFKGDNGEILDIAPDTIIIPNVASLKADVFGALGADKNPVTAGSNAMNYQYGRWNIIIWPYLNALVPSADASTAWILMDSRYNDAYGSAIWFDRVPLTVRSEIDPNTDANVWRGRARWGAGFNDWRGFMYCGHTTNADSAATTLS